MDFKCDVVESLRNVLSHVISEEEWKTDNLMILHVMKVMFFRLHQKAGLQTPKSDPWVRLIHLRRQLAGSERCFQQVIQSLSDKFFITLSQRASMSDISSLLENWQNSKEEAEDFCSLLITPKTSPSLDTTMLSTAVVQQIDAAVSNLVSELSLDAEITSLRRRLLISQRNIGETCTYTYAWCAPNSLYFI